MSDISQGPGWWQASDSKWYPPQSRPGPARLPQQPAYLQPQQRGRSGCLTAAIIGGVVVAVVVVVIVVAVAVGIHHVSTANSSTAHPCPASYPDKQSTDHCANAAHQVTLSGVTATAGALRRGPDQLGQSEICSDVTYRNTTGATQPYNELDWKLQTPTGQVQTFDFAAGNTLNSGVVVSKGTTSGTLSFADQGASGLYTLIWKPSPFEAARSGSIPSETLSGVLCVDCQA